LRREAGRLEVDYGIPTSEGNDLRIGDIYESKVGERQFSLDVCDLVTSPLKVDGIFLKDLGIENTVIKEELDDSK
jgi:hypothetical protein